jgi:hypothetical protein
MWGSETEIHSPASGCYWVHKNPLSSPYRDSSSTAVSVPLIIYRRMYLKGRTRKRSWPNLNQQHHVGRVRRPDTGSSRAANLPGVHIRVFWVMTRYLVGGYQSFGGIKCLHLQGTQVDIAEMHPAFQMQGRFNFTRRYSDWLWARRPRDRSSIPGRAKFFSSLFQTGSGAHPVS